MNWRAMENESTRKTSEMRYVYVYTDRILPSLLQLVVGILPYTCTYISSSFRVHDEHNTEQLPSIDLGA
jgi:hypothetical protein